MDAQTLREVMGSTLPDGGYSRLIDGYNNAMRAAEINTVERAAMFAAQLGHESYGLRYMEEIADGSAYEGRHDLGNTQPGDGRRFKGRGPIQLTGRANYRAFTRWAQSNGYTTLDFEREPHHLSEPHWGFLAAAYYWTVARPQINTWSDKRDLERVTRAINGGTNGINDRRLRYQRALTYGQRLLPTKGQPVSKKQKQLDYPRDHVTQDTYYNCGPASAQTIILAATGDTVPESTLGSALGTTKRGTDYIGQFPKVLNQYLPDGKYTHRDIANDPPTKFQKEQLWRDIVGSIDAGFGVVANIVAPPSNYPRAVAPSTVNFNYGPGTIYHYIAVMGYSDDDGTRKVWIADSGFYPYGGWIAFDQLATLIPPKGYAYATTENTERKDKDVTTRVLLGGESAGALHEAKVAAKNTDEATQRIEKTVTLVADQMLGWPKDEDGNYLIAGWNFDTVVEAAETKIKQGKGITLVEQVALLQKQNQHMAESLQGANESIEHLIEALEAMVK